MLSQFVAYLSNSIGCATRRRAFGARDEIIGAWLARFPAPGVALGDLAADLANRQATSQRAYENAH
jgi:hypothetical protein